jgi:crotonobetainyl-CoA:carnitine CoA-transferase CaiB-like acyl-CoA transferase
VLPTSEGHWVVIAGHPASNGTFERYCRAMDRPDLIEDPRLQTVGDRRRHHDLIMDALRAWSSTFDDLDAIEGAFEAQGLAMGVLRTVREIGESDWVKAREAVVEVPDRVGGVVRVPNSPWHFSGADSGVRGQPAYRGEHNREILVAKLGLGEDELDRLEASGVLSSRLPRG